MQTYLSNDLDQDSQKCTWKSQIRIMRDNTNKVIKYIYTAYEYITFCLVVIIENNKTIMSRGLTFFLCLCTFSIPLGRKLYSKPDTVLK